MVLKKLEEKLSIPYLPVSIVNHIEIISSLLCLDKDCGHALILETGEGSWLLLSIFFSKLISPVQSASGKNYLKDLGDGYRYITEEQPPSRRDHPSWTECAQSEQMR